jgi:hypothetical protein
MSKYKPKHYHPASLYMGCGRPCSTAYCDACCKCAVRWSDGERDVHRVDDQKIEAKGVADGSE